MCSLYSLFLLLLRLRSECFDVWRWTKKKKIFFLPSSILTSTDSVMHFFSFTTNDKSSRVIKKPVVLLRIYCGLFFGSNDSTLYVIQKIPFTRSESNSNGTPRFTINTSPSNEKRSSSEIVPPSKNIFVILRMQKIPESLLFSSQIP